MKVQLARSIRVGLINHFGLVCSACRHLRRDPTLILILLAAKEVQKSPTLNTILLLMTAIIYSFV